ncbi:MAG: RagB/SusD family nutrient uptake outer membrane protein [Chitinophagaceae bacterium]|nr:RagB/SusD family nutrient uptake outer membrane protein [Chitinophagaceae bacterium]
MLNINRIKIWFIVILGMLALGSCKKFLDVPLTTELETNYFIDENRVQRGVGSIYASISNIYGANLGSQISQNGVTIHPLWLLQGDDLTTSGSGSNTEYEAFSGFSPSDARVAALWQKFYFLIARANFILDKLDDPEVSKVFKTPGLKDNNKGEALFLRAWINYKLWDMFRKAPLQSERINSIEESVIKPSKGFELLDAAIADLEEAALLLPESWEGMNKGRVFKNSANGLLVKCYVLRACYASAYGGNQAQDYAKAISAFEKISGISAIEGVPYGDNFDYRTENNIESLFEYQASHGTISDNPWLDNDIGSPVGSFGAMYHYFDSHWGNYGSGGGSIGPTAKLRAMFDPLDPRVNETFKLAQNVDNVGGKLWWLGTEWSYFDGYQFVKYINGERGDRYDVDFQIMSSNNPRILRLADVKLLAAEAYLKTGDPVNALKQVNDVRKRARLSTPNGVESAVPADYSSVEMQQIMDERLLELAGEENTRWSDLRRWHAAGYINLGSWTAADFSYPYNPNLFTFDVKKHLLFPIPSTEMTKNPLLMADGNNPGYN